MPPDPSTPPDADLPLTAQILALLARVSERFEPGDGDTKRWIMDHYGNPALADLLQDATLMTLRVLDAIGRLEPVNGITVSKQFRIPKGSVSKITRRLLAQKLVSRESLPNNKKEIIFRLTPLGRELFSAHRAFDEQMERGFVQFLQRYEAGELQFIVRLLTDLTTAAFLDTGTPKDSHA